MGRWGLRGEEPSHDDLWEGFFGQDPLAVELWREACALSRKVSEVVDCALQPLRMLEIQKKENVGVGWRLKDDGHEGCPCTPLCQKGIEEMRDKEKIADERVGIKLNTSSY